MNLENFHKEFKDRLKELGLKKNDVMNHLGITLPTLNSKLNDPRKLTLGDIEKLREIKLWK